MLTTIDTVCDCQILLDLSQKHVITS